MAERDSVNRGTGRRFLEPAPPAISAGPFYAEDWLRCCARGSSRIAGWRRIRGREALGSHVEPMSGRS